MGEIQSSFRKERNPITAHIHQREVFWQITIPFVVGILVILGVAIFTAVSAGSETATTGRWAHISTIWLVLLTCAPSLIITLVLAAFAYLMIRLVDFLPPYAKKAQDIFYLIQIKVRSFADKVASIFIKTNSFFASVRSIFRP